MKSEVGTRTMVLWAPCPDPDKLHSSFVWGRKSEGGNISALFRGMRGCFASGYVKCGSDFEREFKQRSPSSTRGTAQTIKLQNAW